MKRSEVNQIIRKMEHLTKEQGFALPPFCKFTPEEWEDKGEEYQEIRDNQLGWDITDYGQENYNEVGMALITLRNGNQNNSKYTKSYAEKLIMMQEGQTAPMHFHWSKMEDIINRGGGNILITVYNSTEDGNLSQEPVEIHCDGRAFIVEAGTKIRLTPGESITIYQGMYHDFEVEQGTGDVLLGEVSMCNDDNTDNRFYRPVGRFPKIEEDEKPYRLLCNEYPEGK